MDVNDLRLAWGNDRNLQITSDEYSNNNISWLEEKFVWENDTHQNKYYMSACWKIINVMSFWLYSHIFICLGDRDLAEQIYSSERMNNIYIEIFCHVKSDSILFNGQTYFYVLA